MKEQRKPVNGDDLASVRVDALRHIERVISGMGGDAAALLNRAQIDRRLLDQGKGVISHARMAGLLEQASVELGCPDLGLRLAASQATQGATKVFGPLHVAMCHSPTLGMALRYFADHVHAYSTAVRVHFRKNPGDARVFMLLEPAPPGLTAQRQSVEHALALLQHAVRALSAGRVQAREIWIMHAPVAPASTYRTHLNATVRFGQDSYGLFFDDCDLELTLPNADPQLYEIATCFIERRFPAAGLSLGEKVRIIIAQLLVGGQCTHEHVAASVGMHPRTLQRRLRIEGETFEAIKDAVRRDVALRYLQQPGVSLMRVSEILGYSETSVLSRSCHRWFSASPSELRNAASR